MIRIIAKKAVDYDYSCVLVNAPQALVQKVVAFGKKHVKESDLYTDPEDPSLGRETDSHVTVKYGLHTNDLDEVKQQLKKFKGGTLALGKVTFFEPEDKPYDVVKIDVTGDVLYDMHNELSKMPNSDSHPQYKPHMTIAYVKKGKCRNLLNNSELEGQSFDFDRLTFNPAEGKEAIIRFSS